MAVVTIGGLTGGGGRLLGPLVAQRLGADYVDRLILTDTARHVGATVEALHQREERPLTKGERFARLLQRILERSAVAGAGGDPYFGPGAVTFLTQEYEDLPQPIITRGHELEDEKYIEGLRPVMREVAVGDNVVVVGRGGAVILRDIPGVLRVGVVANIEDRTARIMDRDRVDREQAKKIIESRDRAREIFFQRFFDIDDPDDPHLYHLSINSSDVSLDYACEVVIQAIQALEDGRLPHKEAAAV